MKALTLRPHTLCSRYIIALKLRVNPSNVSSFWSKHLNYSYSEPPFYHSTLVLVVFSGLSGFNDLFTRNRT